MLILSLLLGFLLQTPVVSTPPVVIGLMDGQHLAVDNAQFTGFIETRPTGESFLLYRQKAFRGELKLSSIQRIDFGYKKGKPFRLSVTLKTGQKLDLESDRRDYVTVKGSTDTGSVLVKHPDPVSVTTAIRTRQPNRKSNLTIQYLEFPR